MTPPTPGTSPSMSKKNEHTPRPETTEPPGGGSKVSPQTQGPPVNPPSQGDPTNPAQPRH